MRVEDLGVLQELDLVPDVQVPSMSGAEYIEVRGTWPIYFNGAKSLKLVGADRGITLADARVLFQAAQV